MKLNTLLFALFFVIPVFQSFAQPDISYYLPANVNYDTAIPTPKSVIGFEVGEWHVSHDRLVSYMQALDKASDRISIEITGYTHEARPLLLLTITSPANHNRIESIRTEHLLLTDASKSNTADIKKMPAVFYAGFSIHGNEPSGSNASMLFAYHLAAAQGEEIDRMLNSTVILLDPSFNPDGMQRFSGWVNSRKGKNIAVDPNDSEHNEAWPNGRTNHYWFDLNRDWLVAQQPESQARARMFHRWKPNLLTDHHEMGVNSTFFFQPGVPSRMHPLTPEKNFALTKKMGSYHAKALDEIGSLYFTQQGYDDFYYGKGSTFPDVQGGVGILFEQASSRGHAQESVNGVLRFPFTIRNQFVTALSSWKAVYDMREEFLDYQRQFFKDAASEAQRDPMKSIVFGSQTDPARAWHLAEIIARHQITIYRPASSITVAGKNISQHAGYIIPLNQPQYKLIRSMFEKRTRFKDSLFYDISSWTLPLAASVDYEELKTVPATGEVFGGAVMPVGKQVGGVSKYAYVIEASPYYLHRSVYKLLQQNFRVKVATDPFFGADGKKFERGSVIIPVEGQEGRPEVLDYLLREISEKDGIDVYNFSSGLDYNGSSLGSNSFVTLKKPEVAILVEGGISANDAGEIWHLLDTRFNMPVTLLPLSTFNTTNLARYNTIIFPTGTYTAVTEAAKEKLKTWVQGGGLVIGFETALTWLNASGIGKFDMKKEEDKKDIAKPLPYGDIDEYRGAQETSGAIFDIGVDLTNPLLYGYSDNHLSVFKGNNLFMEKSKNPYGNPATFGSSPLISGYISKANYTRLKDSAMAGVSVLGRGRVIGFTENLAFRAFWFGTNKMLMNAIFYGPIINEGSAR